MSKASSALAVDETKEIVYIDPESIMPNKSQPRTVFEAESLQKLSESIKKYGIIQPLTVRKIEKSAFSTFKYELIAGERRLRASKLAGLGKVPCVIINADEQTSAAMAIIENLHRDDLNVFEEAAAIASLIEIHKLTQEKIAEELSITQSAVANKLRILRLSSEERALILQNGLSERHARAFLKIKDENSRLQAVKHTVNCNFNVKQTEDYVESLLQPKETAPTAKVFDRNTFIISLTKLINVSRESGAKIKTSKTESDVETVYMICISKK